MKKSVLLINAITEDEIWKFEISWNADHILNLPQTTNEQHQTSKLTPGKLATDLIMIHDHYKMSWCEESWMLEDHLYEELANTLTLPMKVLTDSKLLQHFIATSRDSRQLHEGHWDSSLWNDYLGSKLCIWAHLASKLSSKKGCPLATDELISTLLPRWLWRLIAPPTLLVHRYYRHG